MFAYFKAALGLFSLLGKLAPLGRIASFFSWIPGGQLIGIFGAILGAILAFFRWLVVDITDAFKEPQRLVVRTMCVLGALGFGVYFGIKHDAHRVEEKQAVINQIIKDARIADDANKAKLAKALEAKKLAEDAERVKADPVNPAPAQPKRVRKASSGSGGGQSGSWLPTFPALFGGPSQTKPK